MGRTFASAFTLITLALCVKCRRTLKGTLQNVTCSNETGIMSNGPILKIKVIEAGIGVKNELFVDFEIFGFYITDFQMFPTKIRHIQIFSVCVCVCECVIVLFGTGNSERPISQNHTFWETAQDLIQMVISQKVGLWTWFTKLKLKVCYLQWYQKIHFAKFYLKKYNSHLNQCGY